MIRALLAARYVTFSAVVILLVALALWGRRVSYEQSISSFFAPRRPFACSANGRPPDGGSGNVSVTRVPSGSAATASATSPVSSTTMAPMT